MGKIAEQIRFSNQPFFEEATQDWTDNLAEICGLSTLGCRLKFGSLALQPVADTWQTAFSPVMPNAILNLQMSTLHRDPDAIAIQR